MAKMVFNGEDVRVLYEHAKAAVEHRVTFEMLCNPAYLKQGVTLKKGEYAKDEQIDKSKIPPSMVFVKDQGVYLMSSGIPGLPGEGSLNRVVYAKGLGKDADYDDIAHAAGGDDFAESLPLSMFDQAMAERATSVAINLSARKISVTWTPGPGVVRQPVAKRVRPACDTKELGAAMKACGATVKSQWAASGCAYKGVVAAMGDVLVYQKVRRGVIVHEKALLPGVVMADAKGKVVTINYPADLNGVGSVSQ